MSTPKLVLKFDEPQHGYWDGGAKHGGEFYPTLQQDNMGSYVKWGSCEGKVI